MRHAIELQERRNVKKRSDRRELHRSDRHLDTFGVRLIRVP